MNKVKKTKEYTVYKKRSGRFGVKNKQNQWVNGDDKVSILLKEKLIKLVEPKKAPEPEAPAEEVKTEASAPEATEAPAQEEPKAEAAPATEEEKKEEKAE
ncbi:MAG TPA: hypothetical protein PKC21_04380 [Oligoflexia bacterium]|nr:hypothetical protein [Oligoflexia bacterium]HMR24574.1 hypothetical protein [Oligoflexia bacterium]